MAKKRQKLVEEIEFKPLPVKDALKQIKDIFSFMLDLAFYAYAWKNRDISKIVLELEKEVNKLSYFLIMNAALSARDPESAEAAAVIIKVSEALVDASNAAADIACLPLVGISPHKLVLQALRKSEEVIESFTIKEEGKLNGIKVSDLEKLGIYVDVLAIKRQGKMLLSLRDDLSKIKFEPGDLVIVRGNDVAIEKFKEVNGEHEQY